MARIMEGLVSNVKGFGKYPEMRVTGARKYTISFTKLLARIYPSQWAFNLMLVGRVSIYVPFIQIIIVIMKKT